MSEATRREGPAGAYTGPMPPPLPVDAAQAPPPLPPLPDFIVGPPGEPPATGVPRAQVPPPLPAEADVAGQQAVVAQETSQRAMLDYQFPSTRSAGSQWATDDRAYGGCMVYTLLVLSLIGVVLGGVMWLISLFFTG